MKNDDNFGDASQPRKTRHILILDSLAPAMEVDPAGKRYTDEVLYQRKRLLSIAGTQTIVDAATGISLDGVCNFDAGKVPVGINMAIMGISCKIGVDSTKALAIDNVRFSNFNASLDGAILNTEIEVNVNGKLLPRVRICDLMAEGDTTTSNSIGRNNIFWFSNGIPAKEGASVKVQLISPAAGTLNTGANNYWIEVSLFGPGFRDK